MRVADLISQLALLPSLVLMLGGVGLAAEPGLAERPAVFASIKPIYALVAGVMEGVGSPELLVSGAASEHDYALLPSQARALAGADVVFWVGPGLEAFLQRPLATIAARAHIVELSSSPGIVLLPVQDQGQASAFDMHIWLDPENASAMVREIARQLQIHDQKNALVYAKNMAALQVRISALQSQIHLRLSRAHIPPYMVFHSAYQYFETRFGLKPVAAISLAPERQPGAARLRYLRQLMADAGVACVFAEPQYPRGVVQSLIRGTKARTAILDPLGARIEDGGELYFTLMNQLTAAFIECGSPG